jgi:alpha-D-xyloside xylohydrolase
MQVGDSSSEMPWEFTTANGRTTASLDTYRKYARLHMELFPYVWSLAQQMRDTGYPIVRPFGLAAPDSGAHPSDQYFLGESLLVAPVITAGATSRSVRFPVGEWLDWWTGIPAGANGAMATVAADLDTLPLFIKRGAIVPMLRDTIDTLAPTTMAGVESYVNDPGLLVVRIAPGPHSAFTMFDMTTIEQEQGAPSTITYTAGMTFVSGALFELISVAAPAAVETEQGPLPQLASLPALQAAPSGWFYDPAATGGTLWIKVAGSAKIATR